MEIENHKEEVPFEHYLDKFHTLDPKEAAQRLNILYDESAKKFQLRFLGHLYEVEYPDFHVTVLDKPQEDMEKDLLMTSLPAQTFIMRYLLEGQYIASSGKFMTFREVPTYGLKAFSEAMEKIPGCEKIDMGDVAYEFELVNGYRMRFIFWEGDEEFPPSAQILYSDNFQFGFHAEDMVVAGDLSITTVKMLCV